jgi:ribosomal protein S30
MGAMCRTLYALKKAMPYSCSHFTSVYSANSSLEQVGPLEGLRKNGAITKHTNKLDSCKRKSECIKKYTKRILKTRHNTCAPP